MPPKLNLVIDSKVMGLEPHLQNSHPPHLLPTHKSPLSLSDMPVLRVISTFLSLLCLVQPLQQLPDIINHPAKSWGLGLLSCKTNVFQISYRLVLVTNSQLLVLPPLFHLFPSPASLLLLVCYISPIYCYFFSPFVLISLLLWILVKTAALASKKKKRKQKKRKYLETDALALLQL